MTEREKFEAAQIAHVQGYSKGRYMPHLERTGDGYQNPLVHASWQGWQAHAASQVPMTEGEIDTSAQQFGFTTNHAPPWFAEIIRAVEAHHGIGKETS